jgi:DNA-directed RNA polymerase specialized sigma24 family protein
MAPQTNMPFDEVTLSRRFPFRSEGPEDSVRALQASNVAITNVQRMVWKLVKATMPKDLTHEDLEDVVQDCNLHLHSKSLPEFDADRGYKVSTFLHTCIWTFSWQRRRVIMQRKNAASGRPAFVDDSMEMIEAPDQMFDSTIEEIAQAILATPDKFFTRKQATVLRHLVANEGRSMQELSRELGYHQASSFSNMKRRVRERIESLSIADYVGTGRPEVPIRIQ